MRCNKMTITSRRVAKSMCSLRSRPRPAHTPILFAASCLFSVIEQIHGKNQRPIVPMAVERDGIDVRRFRSVLREKQCRSWAGRPFNTKKSHRFSRNKRANEISRLRRYRRPNGVEITVPVDLRPYTHDDGLHRGRATFLCVLSAS